MGFKLLRRSIRVVSLSLFERDCRPDEFTEGVRASLSGIRPLCSPLRSKHLETRAAKLAIKAAHMKKRHGLSEYASSHPERKQGEHQGEVRSAGPACPAGTCGATTCHLSQQGASTYLKKH